MEIMYIKGKNGGFSKLYTCSSFSLEIIFDAKSTVYVHTSFCQFNRPKMIKAALKKKESLNCLHIYTSETYIFYRDHYAKITNRVS